MSPTERIYIFTEVISRRTDTKASNKLNTSIHPWFRYYLFLQIILERYEAVNIALMHDMERTMEQPIDSSVQRVLSEEEIKEQKRSYLTQHMLHLEVESFYIFTRILLDRIADTFGYYFNYPWKKAGSTHTQLTSWFRKIYRERSLANVSKKLYPLMEQLHNRIGTYRNNFIEHPSEPRLHYGTAWGADKKAQVAPTLLYPSDEEAYSELNSSRTEDLNNLFGVISQYMIEMICFFETNIDKSILVINTTDRT